MMLIDIPNDEKIIIGKAIEFTRKQQNTTINTLIEGVCAKQTYYKIQKEVISESEIYDVLLNKLNLFYDYECKSIVSCEGLWNAFLKQDWTQFNIEKKSIRSKLNKEEIHGFILKNVLDMIENKIDLKIVKELLPLISEEMQEILSYFVLKFLYAEDIQSDSDLSYLKMETFLNQKEYLYLLIKLERYYEATTLCNYLLSETKGEIHYLTLIAKLFIIQAIEPIHFDECCEAIMKDEFYIPDSDSAYLFMYTAGMFYYTHTNYEKAWSYLSKACIQSKYRIPGLLFLYHMETITGHKLPHRYIDEVCECPTEDIFMLLFHYYQMKYRNETYDILEDYLWEHCRYIILKSYPQEIARRIIHDELYWIASKTGDKKRYYQFNKKR